MILSNDIEFRTNADGTKHFVIKDVEANIEGDNLVFTAKIGGDVEEGKKYLKLLGDSYRQHLGQLAKNTLGAS